MKQYEAPVLFNRQVSERYWHIAIDTSMMHEAVEPGQFFHVRCADVDSPFLRRPLSVYQIHENTIEFLYLVKGKGTTEMTRIREGETLDVLGPLGKGFELYKQSETVLLVARGVGIATLAAVAQAAFIQGSRCVAVLSARTNEDLLAAEYLEDFGAEVHKVTEEDGTSDVGNVRDIIETDIMARHTIDSIYTCGSRRLSKLSQSISSTFGIPGEIALEEHMGCAMGACFACVCDIREADTLKSVRVCIDGPVFPLNKVVIE
ncbi:dihydroorotate dehydrogenase electron transfer subunit [Salimicrobium halophilum]|uniref:Dihydroorotate dehydrogenase electron transfer subunit n=1 Tax=Salimicrobium halophilum TaxID=86666 RepID=A0A1G8UGQ9_9BACI|nr:dihydroorotate dehydrogenase electron transfer subunit [Salimicrobium halophilum]SDJ52962.1 dihydroorotate dehydrogenase electron transfer subunit [Salimicrobium halophilum]